MEQSSDSDGKRTPPVATATSGPPSNSGSSSSSSAASPDVSAPLTASAAAYFGCGSFAPLTLHIKPTTGGSFSVVVDGVQTVENLERIISKRIKVPKERFCLMYRESVLQEGTLRDNGLLDGSKLVLTPNVETGRLAQRAEKSVMQALELLSDNQVNDFLSGKLPLVFRVKFRNQMTMVRVKLCPVNKSSKVGETHSKTHHYHQRHHRKQPAVATIQHLSVDPSSAAVTTAANAVAAASAASATTAAAFSGFSSGGSGNSSVANRLVPSTDPNKGSKNLTRTIRKIPKRVFTTGKDGDASTINTTRNVSSGVVIGSIKHHGKGFYSATYKSALHDGFGHPKRDISTIIHILKDLLRAAPQWTRTGTPEIYFEPTVSTSSAVVASMASTSSTATSTAAAFGSAVSTDGATAALVAGATSQHRTTSASNSIQFSHCTAIKTVEMENSKTKSKLDSLRLIMQQKKERREAWKQQVAPYGVPLEVQTRIHGGGNLQMMMSLSAPPALIVRTTPKQQPKLQQQHHQSKQPKFHHQQKPQQQQPQQQQNQSRPQPQQQ